MEMHSEPISKNKSTIIGPAFTTSNDTTKIDDALAKAQSEIETALKQANNPHFGKKYADLNSIWTACREALTKHGISITQWPIHSEDSRLHLITRLACGGQWMQAHFSVPVDKNNAHGFGSATTYAKRYALAAAVGVSTMEEDDDGNGAARPPQGDADSWGPSPDDDHRVNMREPKRPNDAPKIKPSGGKFIPPGPVEPGTAPKPDAIPGFVPPAQQPILPHDVIKSGQFVGKKFSEIPDHELRTYIIGIDSELEKARRGPDTMSKDFQNVYYGAIEELKSRGNKNG